MKRIFLAIGVVASLLLASCTETGWKQSDIAYTTVLTVAGITGIDSIDIYPAQGFVINYTNGGTNLAKYELVSEKDTIADDGEGAYMEFSYVMTGAYEYSDATTEEIKMLDVTVTIALDGTMSYADENVDNTFELGDKIDAYMAGMTYYYTSPETGEAVEYDSSWLFGESVVSVTVNEKYN